MFATVDHVTTCRKGGTDFDAASLRPGKKSVKTGKIEHRRGLPATVIWSPCTSRFSPDLNLLVGWSYKGTLCLFLRCCMPTVALVMLLVMWSCISPLAHADAQSSPLRQSDGTTGLVSPLGDGHAIYTDPHGNKEPMRLGSGPSAQNFNAPHGSAPGTVTPFGTPTPPNFLTPAPLLPLQPKGMAIPQPQAPAVLPAPGRFGPSGERPGR